MSNKTIKCGCCGESIERIEVEQIVPYSYNLRDDLSVEKIDDLDGEKTDVRGAEILFYCDACGEAYQGENVKEIVEKFNLEIIETK